MTLNPVSFAQHVNEQFLRYQLTAFPLTDPDLFAQAEAMLHGRVSSPLFKGPYVSLSRAFKFGPSLTELAAQGIVHPALPGIAEYPSLFAHQYDALKAVQAGHHCLISTGTGSGKTEAFLYPILDQCLRLRDADEPEGIVAILVYPMNALAIDQLSRLRGLLAGTGITFGMYVGSTPASDSDAGNVIRLAQGQGRSEYLKRMSELPDKAEQVVSPWEECVTEADMQAHPPRLLLTNVNQLEMLMTRGRDLGMFQNAPLKFLVFDEAHTYSGVKGAETACLVRRIRAFCRKSAEEVICIGTSATLTDAETGEAAGPHFAERFFGVDPAMVELVEERYEEQEWPRERYRPTVPKADLSEALTRILAAIEVEDAPELSVVYEDLTGRGLPAGDDVWERLHEGLRHNELVFQISDLLAKPRPLTDTVDVLGRRLKRRLENYAERVVDARRQAEAELLCYLALGAAARRGGNPIMRPKLHYFARGLEGAAVAFQDDKEATAEPKLYFSAQQAVDDAPMRQPSAVFPIWVCGTCGQHYFRSWLEGLSLDGGELKGGRAEGSAAYWPPASPDAGARLTFTNRFIGELWDEDESDSQTVTKTKGRLDRHRLQAYVCAHCGALHKSGSSQCASAACKQKGDLVPVDVVVTDAEGNLKACPTCGQSASRYGDRVREPIRPMRATTVADVHILAQDMVAGAEHPHQKLICFADNRQDAAFQAGWMQDHARRYRMRHLIYNVVREGPSPISIGDVQEKLLRTFDQDRDLARTLAPEVFEGLTEEAFGRTVKDNLRKYVRIALLSEFATGLKQRESLETWGMTRVLYAGLTPDDPDIIEWASRYGWTPGELCEGIAALLDTYRRNRYFHDPQEPIFGRWWREGDEEIMRGYIPFWDFPPKGIKLKRDGKNDDKANQIVSEKGATSTYSFVSRWWALDRRPTPADIRGFIGELWAKLTDDLELVVPVTLKGGKGSTLPGNQGVHQVAADAIGLVAQDARYRCNVCRRVHTRPTPGQACTAIHCNGKLNLEMAPDHDYNVSLLERPFSMLRPEEHTAQVPPKRRESFERDFKDPDGHVNCLVATPTLELGVNIGALDMVLMRNVPPLSANYWQRAGRAGREHRMAVTYTYCRRSIHDEYFFEDPLRLLGGEIQPPQFNLKNDVMLGKHIHATILSELTALSRSEAGNDLPPAAAEEIRDTLRVVFPRFIRDYLFVDGKDYRTVPYDVSPLRTVVSKHAERLRGAIADVFARHWPEEAADDVSPEAIASAVSQITSRLQSTVDALHRRLAWALATQRRLADDKKRRLLDEFEQRLERRCEAYIRGLSKESARNYTLSVLAHEGFLPSYGSYNEGVVAFAQRAWARRAEDLTFELSRPPSLAVREFVPGNMIYANGGRFRVALYHFPVGEDRLAPDTYVVDPTSDSIREGNAKADSYASDQEKGLLGVPICDTDLAFLSRISDVETYRFQVPVKLIGYLKQGHSGGTAYSLADRELRHMRNQHLRLVNVGPADRVARGDYGYPICVVCGAVRSPYASDDEFEHFRSRHREACGTEPGWVALSADDRVDGLVIDGFSGRAEAVNLAEALRIGAGQVMEMDSGDLQYIPITSEDGVRLFFYDPMPGGSGLLSQILERWGEVNVAAQRALAECSAACEDSCYECMRSYFNMAYHRELNRHEAVELLKQLEAAPVFAHDIAAVADVQTGAGSSKQSNADRLLQMIERAGFQPLDREQSVKIGKPYDNTVPDFSYRNEAEDIQVAIYLDGLSKGIHGNTERQQIDRLVRQQLEADGWDVIEIANSDLDDLAAIRAALTRLAKALGARDARKRVREGDAWYGAT